MFLLYKDSTQFVDFPGLMNFVKEDCHGTHLAELLSFFVEIIFFPGYKGGENAEVEGKDSVGQVLPSAVPL